MSNITNLSELEERLCNIQELPLEHELKKVLLLSIHELKNQARISGDSGTEQRLLNIEQALGFGDAEADIVALRDCLTIGNTTSELPDEVPEHATFAESSDVEPEQSAPFTGICLILTNCPGRDPAREMARTLVEKHHAACVNVIANIGAIYWWEGEIHDTAECQLQIKTSAERVDEVLEDIQKLHPHDVPEILVMPIEKGNQAYFDWVNFETGER